MIHQIEDTIMGELVHFFLGLKDLSEWRFTIRQ